MYKGNAMRKILCNLLCAFIPSRKMRRKIRKHMLTPRIQYKNNNKLIIHALSGKQIINPKYIDGLKIDFVGKNSQIDIYEPSNFINSSFLIYDNVKIIIKKTSYCCLKLGAWHDSTVFIDENVRLAEVDVCMMNERGTGFRVGKNSVISVGCIIYTTDTHPMLDNFGNIINATKSTVDIGEHCWVCRNVTLLKGTKLEKNTIVGNRSVVTKAFSEPGVVIAGNPAKIVKRDINWCHGIIN